MYCSHSLFLMRAFEILVCSYCLYLSRVFSDDTTCASAFEYFNQAITCAENEACTVNCGSSRCCVQTTINCPTNATCTVTCDAQDACQTITINAQNSSALTVIANEDDVLAPYTSVPSDIYCPRIIGSPTAICTLTASAAFSDAFDQLNVYSIETADSLTIACVGGNSNNCAPSDNSMTVHCTASLTESCSLARSDYTCAVNSDKCENYVVTESPTLVPSAMPTVVPTAMPSAMTSPPSSNPSTAMPTAVPTNMPTPPPLFNNQTVDPTSTPPSVFPSTVPTVLPTTYPTMEPITGSPTLHPASTGNTAAPSPSTKHGCNGKGKCNGHSKPFVSAAGFSFDFESTIAIGVGIVALLLFLCILIFCLCGRRRSRKKKDRDNAVMSTDVVSVEMLDANEKEKEKNDENETKGKNAAVHTSDGGLRPQTGLQAVQSTSGHDDEENFIPPPPNAAVMQEAMNLQSALAMATNPEDSDDSIYKMQAVFAADDDSDHEHKMDPNYAMTPGNGSGDELNNSYNVTAGGGTGSPGPAMPPRPTSQTVHRMTFVGDVYGEMEHAFGQDLSAIEYFETVHGYKGKLPRVLVLLEQELYNHKGYVTAGIFDAECIANNPEMECFKMASFMLQFFQKLPEDEPLIDPRVIHKGTNKSAMWRVTSALHEPHASILLFVWNVCAKVVVNAKQTHMNVPQLATIFAPVITMDAESKTMNCFANGIQWRCDNNVNDSQN